MVCDDDDSRLPTHVHLEQNKAHDAKHVSKIQPATIRG